MTKPNDAISLRCLVLGIVYLFFATKIGAEDSASVKVTITQRAPLATLSADGGMSEAKSARDILWSAAMDSAESDP